MSTGLAEEHLDDSPARKWLIRGGLLLAFVAVVLTTIWAVRGLKSSDAPKRQVAKISLLPDTPPPPPPPKEEKKSEPPKDEPKQVMREEQLKQAEAPKPANEPLKMEGAAGDSPSAFAAGGVKSDYSGGTPNTGAAQTGTSSDRAQERFYGNTARQILRDAIERHLKSDATQATAEFSVWIARDGGISRFELRSTGDGRLDAELNAALDETARALKLPPPPNAAAQPMKFRLNVRPLG
jgi:protein TonB